MRLTTGSTEYLTAPVPVVDDPTSLTVEGAIVPRRTAPASGDWGTASWAPGLPWAARLLVGPSGDYQPAPGLWDVWARVLGTTEAPALRVGVLAVTPLPEGLGPDVPDVAAALRRELTGGDVDACEDLLDGVVGDAEGVLHKTLTQRQVVEVRTVDPQWGRRGVANVPNRGATVVLSKGRVASIDLVRFLPAEPGASWAEIPLGNYLPDGNAVILDVGFPGSAEVTYTTTGLEPDALRAVSRLVVQRTARLMNKRADDVVGTQTSGVEGSTVTYLDDEWTESELKSLRSRARLVAV